MSKKSRKSKTVTHTRVHTTISRLRAAVEVMNESHSRYAANDFLLEVYRAYFEWFERGCADKYIKRLNRQLGLDGQKTKQPFKTLIIAANPSLEAKLRSRWVRALEYALSENTKPDLLSKLFRLEGGIAGCARSAAKTDPKRDPLRDDWGFDHTPFMSNALI